MIKERKPQITVRYVYHDHVDVYQGVVGGQKKLMKTETIEEYKAWKKEQGLDECLE